MPQPKATRLSRIAVLTYTPFGDLCNFTQKKIKQWFYLFRVPKLGWLGFRSVCPAGWKLKPRASRGRQAAGHAGDPADLVTHSFLTGNPQDLGSYTGIFHWGMCRSGF